MKQVTQTLRNGEVQVAEVPVPSLRAGGVLVRNSFSVISSGTERAKVELARQSLLNKAKSRPEQVMQVLAVAREQSPWMAYRRVTNRLSSLEPLGYSCAGKIIAVASDVEEFRVGDWVACAGGEYANHAEIVFVPKNLCAKAPQNENAASCAVGPEAAAFATLGAIALQGVRQADPKLGEAVVVMGLGLIGLLTVQLLKASGCSVLGLEPNPERCRIAISLGCRAAALDQVQLINELTLLNQGAGADAVILTAASRESSLMPLAGEICRDRGRVVVVGDVPIEVPRSPYYEKELEVRMSRSYGPGRYDPNYEDKGHDYPLGYVRWTEKRNMEAFLNLVADGRVQLSSLITHRFPIEKAADAYEMILEGRERFLGVLLEYPSAGTDEMSQLQSVVLGTTTYRRSAARTPAESIGIGLLGAGNFAQNVLVPAIKENLGVHLRGVVSRSGLRARHLANRFGFEYCSTNVEEVLADPHVNAVVIATRHDTHAKLALQALQAGKAVFVEKPLAINRSQLQEIAGFWRGSTTSGGRIPFLMVGYNRRFAEATRLAREFLSDVAEPLVMSCRVNAGYLPPGHWLHDPESGGGRIIGEGCHFVDLLSFLAGSSPREVYAQALPVRGCHREDNLVAQLRFANHSLATLSYLANGDKRVSKEHLEIFGGGATVIVDDFRSLIRCRQGRRQRHGWWWKQDKGHRSEIGVFLDAVRNGKPSPIPFEELLWSTAATLCIVDSLRSKAAIRIDDAYWRNDEQ